jgi:peptide chain release factor subunit 1
MSDDGQDHKLTEKERYKLKRFVEELDDQRGSGTELVSIYIPKGYNIDKIRTMVTEEKGTASNIKSKKTRDNVQAALSRIEQHLKLFPETPDNGLAIFAGDVSDRDGQQDVELWSIEPPVPINQRLYRCDKTFQLDPLKQIADDSNTYGMIVMDRREGNLALLKGKQIIPLTSKTSNVPGKFKAGGQSAQRFARIREGEAKKFYKKIARMAKDQFYDREDIQGILVGGPGHTKNEFVDGNYLPQPVKDEIITIKDLSYTGEYGLEELLEKSKDVLAAESVAQEKTLMNDFFTLLNKEPGKVTYGHDQTMKAVKMGAVDTVLLSETVDDETVDTFINEAEEVSSDVEIISTDTGQGKQLAEIGGIAALLRYNAGDTF